MIDYQRIIFVKLSIYFTDTKVAILLYIGMHFKNLKFTNIIKSVNLKKAVFSRII